MQENMAKKAKAIENKVTKSKSEEENDTDGGDENTEAVGPATPRAVMPTMTLPIARVQPATLQFNMSKATQADNTAEKAQTMIRPSSAITTIPEEQQNVTPEVDGRENDD